MDDKPPQGKVNHLGMIPAMMDVWAATTTRSITSPFVRKKGGARTYRRDVFYAMLREVLSGFDVHEGQYLLPGTDKVYKNVSKSKKWKANSVKLDFGAKGHWLGHADARYVMIYFHGGGYISPGSLGHMKYQFALQKYLRKQGIDISIFSLSYILAPHALYPEQLRGALSSLKYLINDTQRDPSTILLGGDSAGGNLVAELLLHLGHPHPDVGPFPLEKRLKGALLISPWISFETTSPSFTANKYSDYLTVEALNRASNSFIGADADHTKHHDEYSEPINAPVDWWREVAEKVVDDVLIWGGGGEVLIDGIRAFAGHVITGFELAEGTLTPPSSSYSHRVSKVAENGASMGDPAAVANGASGVLQKSTSKCERAKLFVSPQEAHEEMIIDYLLFIKKEEDGGRQIKKWLTWLLAADHDKRTNGNMTEKEHEKIVNSGEKTDEQMLEEVAALPKTPLSPESQQFVDAKEEVTNEKLGNGHLETEAEQRKEADRIAPVA